MGESSRVALHLFPRRFLEDLLSPICKVVAIDGPTANFSRPSVSRACVLINLLKENPYHIWLEMGGVKSCWQKVCL